MTVSTPARDHADDLSSDKGAIGEGTREQHEPSRREFKSALHDVLVTEFHGERALVLCPEIREDDPDLDVMAARRSVNLGHPCPYCGAVLRMPNRRERREAARKKSVLHVTVEHESDCPVHQLGRTG